jgi:hypothetical protein
MPAPAGLFDRPHSHFSSIARFQRLGIGFDTKSRFAQNTAEETVNLGRKADVFGL